MKFKDVVIGSIFYFPAYESWRSPDGPYVKTGTRTYRDEPRRHTTDHHVGTVNSNVINSPDSPDRTQPIQYASDYTLRIVPVPRFGVLQMSRGQSPTGYGRKIATDYMIRLNGGKIWRRVYAICFSNVASHYVVIKGDTLYLRDSELEAARDAAHTMAPA